MIQSTRIHAAALAHRSPVSVAAFAPAPGMDDKPNLLERLICDLHWSLLHVGALAQITEYCARHDRHALRSWRHLLNDNSSAALLTLRFASDLGLSCAMAASLTKFEQTLSVLQLDTSPFASSQTGALDKRALLTLAERWREIAKQGRHLLQALAPYRQRLPNVYRIDAHVLDGFLGETAHDALCRMSATGEINLPPLLQRRRTLRQTAKKPCALVVSGKHYDASLIDVSIDGFGITCQARLQPGMAVQVMIASRSFQAKVVWTDGDRHGLRNLARLHADEFSAML